MPSQSGSVVENNFTKGLQTDFTGLNFPENAATDTDNCTYSLLGDVTRRFGINKEVNGTEAFVDRSGKAVQTYVWKNAGGGGTTQLEVVQLGGSLIFYSITAATAISPLSTQLLIGQTQDISGFVATDGVFDAAKECQFTDGNGYLFVFHPSCDPFFVIYTAGTTTVQRINVQIRDFAGIPEPGVPDGLRPSSLSPEHQYNLQNQGWTSGNPWSATSTTSITVGTGAKVFTVAGGLTITPGQVITATGYRTTKDFPTGTMTGTVTSYVGTTLTLSISSVTGSGTFIVWDIIPISTGYMNTWFSAVGNYPSNSDQWWRFKNASNVFDPTTTQANISVSSGPAPKGHYIMRAFEQYRTSISGVTGITNVSTTTRPAHGTWFQGRVWYSGVNDSQAATGNAPFTTWTENIYFSRIVENISDFGKCYQDNDPTSEELFDELPTDGGVITITGIGPIYKLFPIQNGIIVFGANGVKFITGNQGIGFTANDYTITELSNIQSISTNSFVNVQGLPYFWNEEGIYSVQPQQTGGLSVNSVTVGVIGRFFEDIPLTSKKYARAAYHPLEYTIQWIYKDAEETSVTDRYSFNRILNYNVYNKAFFPYSLNNTIHSIIGVDYISGPGGLTTVPPSFKYLSSASSTPSITFADEHDISMLDWGLNDYESFLVTGYKLHGQAQRRFQMPYIYVYSRTNGVPLSYKIQGIWDYANTGNSGRWSTAQIYNISEPNFDVVNRRSRIRGRGLTLQLKLKSVTGEPFDFIGWSTFETANAGV